MPAPTATWRASPTTDPGSAEPESRPHKPCLLYPSPETAASLNRVVLWGSPSLPDHQKVADGTRSYCSAGTRSQVLRGKTTTDQQSRCRDAGLFIPHAEGSPALGVSTWPATPPPTPRPAAKVSPHLPGPSGRGGRFCDLQSVGRGRGAMHRAPAPLWGEKIRQSSPGQVRRCWGSWWADWGVAQLLGPLRRHS